METRGSDRARLACGRQTWDESSIFLNTSKFYTILRIDAISLLRNTSKYYTILLIHTIYLVIFKFNNFSSDFLDDTTIYGNTRGTACEKHLSHQRKNWSL